MMELQPSEPQINGGTEPLVVAVSTENVGAKRQRRPSVRLGDIGDPHYDSHLNRRNKSKVKGTRNLAAMKMLMMDFDSDSPLKEQSLLNSMDNVDFDGDRGHYQRIGGTRVRVSEGRRRRKELEEVEERSEKDKKALEFGMCVSRDSSLLIFNSKI
ncbi:hypothetical protein LguiA_005691 [Lonicera macranthoides]